MSRARKWYRPMGMLRAGRPRSVYNHEVHVIAVQAGIASVIGSAQRFALDRDDIGLTKDLARVTAGIARHRLSFFVGTADQATQVARHLNEQAADLPRLQTSVRIQGLREQPT